MFFICFLLDFIVKTFELMTFYLVIYHGLLKQKTFMKFLTPLLRSMKAKGNESMPEEPPGSRRRLR